MAELIQSKPLESLEDRLARLSSAGEALPPDEWPELARLEADLWLAVIGRSARVTAFARDPGHPTLGTVRDWRHALLALGLESLASPLDDHLEQLVAREAQGWRDAHAEGELDPERLFDVREEAARLDREALLLRRRVGSAPPLAGERARLRAAFAAAVRATPPGAALRRRWADRLVDFADEVLAATYELPPDLAADHLELLGERLSFHLDVVEPEDGPGRRRLRKRWRKLRAERQERLLQARLEQTFGRRRMGWWERTVAAAILLIVALVCVPWLTSVPAAHPALIGIEGAACLVLLWDFAYKLWAVRFSGLWFRRHVLTDLLPSLPVSFLHVGVVLRVVRLMRIVQYLRVLMPLVRGFQALGFLARGLDRLARRYGRLLDHDLIVFPTPEERRAHAPPRDAAASTWTLSARVNGIWERTLRAAHSPDQRAALADLRLATLRGAGELPWRARSAQRVGASRADRWVAEHVLERLAGVTSEELEGQLGPEFVARVARAVRALAGSPLRCLPFLRSWLPRVDGSERDADVCADATRGLARRLRRLQRRVLGFADLYGTVTPAEIVGRVGATLVRGTARPAYRLLLLGAALGFLHLLMLVLGADAGSAPAGVEQTVELLPDDPGLSLRGLAQRVEGLVGSTLILIGSVCFLGLGLGLWLQRLANDASTFHDQVARAQFLHLTDSLKLRHLAADVALIDRRVFAPERRHVGRDDAAAAARDRGAFEEAVCAWLLEGRPPPRAERGFDPIPLTVLVYRDLLDGALLTETDARVPNQLLGNLSLKRLRARAQVMDKRAHKALERLDLGRRKASLRGPYLWFQFLCQALAQGAARLVVEFNENALPLEDLARATEGDRREYEAWLARDPEAPQRAARGPRGQQFTTAFTALHFLDDDPRRDAQVEGRFGPAVLRLLERDRRALFRRVFGTWPLHRRPLESRVLNLRDLYHSAFEGGRVFLLPLLLGGFLLRRCGLAVSFLLDAVQRIRKPGRVAGYEDQAFADFDAALRKIDRMRGTITRACVRQRALFDAEYLGLALPGEEPRDGDAPWQADLDYLEAGPELREELARMRADAAADLGRLGRLVEEGLLARADETPRGVQRRSALRALAVAYRADLGGLRSHLSAGELLEEVLDDAAARVALPRRLRPAWRRRRAFRRWWAAHRGAGAPGRRAAWRAVAHDLRGVARALDAWDAHGAGAAARGRELAGEVLRHPGRLTEPLVTLRAVQTLALLDVRNYREHVWRLGDFAAVARDAGPALPE